MLSVSLFKKQSCIYLAATAFSIACSTEQVKNGRDQTETENAQKTSDSGDGLAKKQGQIDFLIATDHIEKNGAYFTKSQNFLLKIRASHPNEGFKASIAPVDRPEDSDLLAPDIVEGEFRFSYDFEAQETYVVEIKSSIVESSLPITIEYDVSASLDFTETAVSVNFVDFANDRRELKLQSSSPFAEDLECQTLLKEPEVNLGTFSVKKSELIAGIEIPEELPSSFEIKINCQDNLSNQANSEWIALAETWDQETTLSVEMIAKESSDGFFYELSGSNELLSSGQGIKTSLIQRNKEDLVMYFHHDQSIDLNAPNTENIFWAQEYASSWTIPYPATLNSGIYISLIRSNQLSSPPSIVLDTVKIDLPK